MRMIYQFTTDSTINRCRECPCCEIADFDGSDFCNLADKWMFPDNEKPDDCPLVEVKE